MARRALQALRFMLLLGEFMSNLDKIACEKHRNSYKKGCKDCFERNKTDTRKDDLWHDQWESHEFGDK